MTNIDTIKAVLTPIFEKYGVKKAVLFGSFAKNTMTEQSDIDLLVDSGLKGLKFVGFTEDIQNAVSRHVDVLDVTHIEKDSGIEKEISRHGKVIFNRTEQLTRVPARRSRRIFYSPGYAINAAKIYRYKHTISTI